jgi:hypothetical protein
MRKLGVRTKADLPKLTEDEVFAWALAHKKRAGCWPTPSCGPIPEAPGCRRPGAPGTSHWKAPEGLRA